MFDLFVIQGVLTVLLFGWLLYQSPRLRRLTLWLLIMAFTLLGFVLDDATNLRICIGLTAFGVLAFKLWESIPFTAVYMLVPKFRYQEPFIGPEEAFPGQARDRAYDLYLCEELELDECGLVPEKIPLSWLEGAQDWIVQNSWVVWNYLVVQWRSFGAPLAVILFFAIWAWVILQIVKYFRSKQHKLERSCQSVLEKAKLQEFFPEKMAPGSHFLPTAGNKFQVEVHCSLDGGPFIYSGQAFRVGKNLWTAWHVVSEADEIKLINPNTKQEMLLDGPTKRTSLFVHVEGDIAVAPLGDKLSTLSLASAKFAAAALDGRTAAFVEICARGQRSMGLLTPHTAFGYAVYSGSTVAGFSGAPYVVNKVVCGMHLGHMSVNLGYDAAYLSMIERTFEKALGITTESTEDWVYEQIGRMKSRGKKFDYSRSPYDPDEVRVRIGGRYYVVSADVMRNEEEDDDYNPMEDYYGEAAERRPDVAPAIFDVVYKDQGNELMAPAPKNVSAGASGEGSQVNVVAPTQTMQSVYQTATLNLSKDLATLVTNLPASTPVQQEDLLNSIQNGQLSLEEILQKGLVYEARNRRHKANARLRKMRSSTKRSEDMRAGSSQPEATPGTSSRVVSKPPLKK